MFIADSAFCEDGFFYIVLFWVPPCRYITYKHTGSCTPCCLALFRQEAGGKSGASAALLLQHALQAGTFVPK